jgi:hypothetical protein
MKKTKTLLYRMASLAMVIGMFSACQMENDLRGSKKDTLGYVNATMIPQATEPMLTRAASLDQYDVNDFPVAIISAEDADTVARYDSYRAMKAAGEIALEAGKYRVVAWMGTDEGDVQTTPYFEGGSDFEVVAQRTSVVEATCKLARVKVAVNISEEFEEAFEDDYSITFNNNHGVETMDVDTKDLSYYFKVYAGDKNIEVTVKATPKGSENTIVKTFTLYKQGENADDGSQLDLDEGDAFRINLSPSDTSDGTVGNPTEGNFIITVDLKWNDRNEEVEIPVEVLDVSADNNGSDNADNNGGDNTDNNGDNESQEGAPVLTPSINGENTWSLFLPYETSADMKVNIDAPATIQQLWVTITSDNLGFMYLIGTMHFEQFDLCDIDDTTTETNVKNILQMAYNDDVKGQTNFTFDVSSFTYALSGFAGEHHFAIRVVDGDGRETTGTLIVTCEGGPDEEEED